MMPTTPSGAMPIFPAGLESVIETRRGIRGVLVSGLWMPLPVMGGDGEQDPPPGDPPPGDPPPASDPPGDQQTFSREYVQGLRQEAAGHRTKSKDLETRLETAEKRLKEIDDQNLSETEKLKKERDEAAAKAETAEKNAAAKLLRAAVIVTAAELKFHDPEDALRHLDQGAIEYDANGDPKNVKKLLEDLVKNKAYLVKSDSDGGAGPNATPNGARRPTHEQAVANTKKELHESGRYTSLL